jgi:outer membrane protein, multidrug efflux system
MTKKILLLLATAALLLAGCTMIPKYNRPDAPVPETWPEGPAYGGTRGEATAPLAGDLGWRDFFTDPRLQKIIETALENNRDLKAAALNVERARAMYRIARSELLPKINANASGSREEVPASTFGDIGWDLGSIMMERYDVNIGISSWELDFFGRIRSLKQRALEEYFATEEARRSAQILLVSEIANAWLALAADQETLDLARATLETQQAAYDLVRRRYEVGLATELELRQVQTQVDAARVDAAKLAELVARDENALNFLAGGPVPEDVYPESLTGIGSMEKIFSGTPSEVLLKRPDILQAESALKAAYANIGAARAVFFPRISLTTAYGTASSELGDLFEGGSRTWNIGSQATLPVFDPRIWSALKVTKVEREIALVQYEGTIQAAFREVADTLAQKGTLGEQMAAQGSLVAATEETYRLSQMRYEKGTDIYLNVLDAQRSLYVAQQGLISIRLADLANQVQLYAVLGGGGDPIVMSEKQ